METKFQTSFIPKKPLVSGTAGTIRSRGPSTSIFMILATVLFIVSLAAAGGAYAYNQYLLTSQTAYQTDLQNRQKEFDPDSVIEKLNTENLSGLRHPFGEPDVFIRR